jgi:putative ABC transport system permease protein
VELVPILSALRRNKTGAVLVVAQIALTLAILSNVISIVADRLALIGRATGLDEHSLFAIGYRLTSGAGSAAALTTDLTNLRSLPQVVDVIATNSYPLRGSGWAEGISRDPGLKSIQEQAAQTAVYAFDHHGIGTLGLKLVAGRNFSTEETQQGNFNKGPMPSVAIVSRALAKQLFPRGDILGQSIYLTSDSNKQVTVIGVVDRLQSPQASSSIDEHQSENSIVLPINSPSQYGLFIIRVKPGSMSATMRRVQDSLLKSNPDRVFGRVRPFDEVRRSAYERDRSMAIALGIICVILGVITALGIVGVTSLWVARRRNQIGIRRALGATRSAIAKHFLLENALLCCAGVLLGILTSHSLSIWLWSHYGSDRLGAAELLICAFLVVSLGQCAAMVPALRAARISPTEAFRSG